jgi:hypothetical protein
MTRIIDTDELYGVLSDLHGASNAHRSLHHTPNQRSNVEIRFRVSCPHSPPDEDEVAGAREELGLLLALGEVAHLA